jgi:uncharacterized membrane protein
MLLHLRGADAEARKPLKRPGRFAARPEDSHSSGRRCRFRFAVDLYDWLLFLHVLSAFLAVGALTALWGLILGTRSEGLLDPPTAMSYGRFFGIVVGVGMMGAIIFGIWLAVHVDGYELWDGWILASLVLWAIAGWAGGQAGRAFEADPIAGRAKGIRFQAISSIGVLLILILMIWKPGA